MRILMLGNSFTFTNNMPQMLADLTGAEVVHHTRGGARLSEQLNPNTRLGNQTQAALQNEQWDYVVLQEMSHGPTRWSWLLHHRGRYHFGRTFYHGSLRLGRGGLILHRRISFDRLIFSRLGRIAYLPSVGDILFIVSHLWWSTPPFSLGYMKTPPIVPLGGV